MDGHDDVDRLYSQFHHEASQNTDDNYPATFMPTATRHVSGNSVVNRPDGVLNNPGAGRYWRLPGPSNTARPSAPSFHSQIIRPFQPRAPGSFNSNHPTAFLQPPSQWRSSTAAVNSQNQSPRVYTSYSSLLNFMEPEKSKKSVFSLPMANSRKNRAKVLSKFEKSKIKFYENRKNLIRPGKLNKVVSRKGSGGSLASGNVKKSAATIILVTDSEEDDVIVIPNPPPPMVNIESSDEEDIHDVGDESHRFVEPLASTSLVRTGDPGGSSRPVSPSSSVMSADDFIAQNDRDRLKAQERSVIPDEDLQCSTLTVYNVLCATRSHQKGQIASNLDESSSSNADESCAKQTATFAECTTEGSSKNDDNGEKLATATITPRISTYSVTETSIQPADVYESESSDNLESVYCRTTVVQNPAATTLPIASASDSDGCDPVVLVAAQSKKLRKRKTTDCSSGSHSPSSGGEDQELDELLINKYFNENKRHSTPAIKRGVAIEGCSHRVLNPTALFRNAKAVVPSPQPPSRKRNKTDDDDFVALLTNLVHGNVDDAVIEVDQTLRDDHDESNASVEVNAKDDASTDKITEESVENVAEGEDDELINQSGLIVVDAVGETGDISLSMIDELEKTEVNEHEAGWNLEMRSFYNESWGDENFEIDNIISKMKGHYNL